MHWVSDPDFVIVSYKEAFSSVSFEKYWIAKYKELPFDKVMVRIKEEKDREKEDALKKTEQEKIEPKGLPLIFEVGDDKKVKSFNFDYVHPYISFKALPQGVFTWLSDLGLKDEGKRGWAEEARVGSTNLIFDTNNESGKNGLITVFEYQCKPEGVVNGCQSEGVARTEKTINPLNYPLHPFNFKVKKLDGDNEVGPEYIVDFNKEYPTIVLREDDSKYPKSVPWPGSQPKPQPQPAKPQSGPAAQPHAPSQLQTNLGRLKNSLAALKGKLGQLKTKLDGLKQKVEIGKTNTIPQTPKFTESKTGSEGTLQFVNLAYLIQQSDKFQQNLSTPAFNIIVYNKVEKFLKFADVAQVMANKLNNNAVFQFASNDDPTWTSGGGHAASVLPATQEAAQRRNKTRDLEPLQKQSLNTKGDDPVNIDNIWIGIHSNIRVTGVADPHKINLIIVAANAAGKYAYPQTDNCQKVAYDGTLLAAAKLDAPNVFLTFMGGAIFASANPREKILAAMTSAVNSYVKKFGLNVTLIYWSDKIPHKDILSLTKAIGGYVCFFESEKKATFKRYPGNNQPGGAVEDIANLTDEQISPKLFR